MNGFDESSYMCIIPIRKVCSVQIKIKMYDSLPYSHSLFICCNDTIKSKF